MAAISHLARELGAGGKLHEPAIVGNVENHNIGLRERMDGIMIGKLRRIAGENEARGGKKKKSLEGESL